MINRQSHWSEDDLPEVGEIHHATIDPASHLSGHVHAEAG